MDSKQISKKLVALCRAGKNLEAVDTLYAPDIVSVEAWDMGPVKRETRGLEAVRAKNVWWLDNHQVDERQVSDAFCAVDKFSVIFDYAITVKASGEKRKMKEVAVFSVKNGKISHEEFFYNID